MENANIPNLFQNIQNLPSGLDQTLVSALATKFYSLYTFEFIYPALLTSGFKNATGSDTQGVGLIPDQIRSVLAIEAVRCAITIAQATAQVDWTAYFSNQNVSGLQGARKAG